MKVLFVCLGNTCRSPMAKAIFEQILKQRGLAHKISADSAAKGYPVMSSAHPNARKAITQLYGKDLLADHMPKSINSIDVDDFDLILTMEESLKSGLPPDKTFTLKEYAGLKGDIQDPWGKPLEDYIKCRDEIKECLEKIIEKLIAEKT